MKTSPLFLAAGALLMVALPAHADDGLGSPLDTSANSSGHHHRGRSSSPAKGLQLAKGLQTSGPLNGSGPGLIAVPLNEDEWRKLFPRKEPSR